MSGVISVTTLVGLLGRGVWVGEALPTEAGARAPTVSAGEIVRAARTARMTAAKTTDEIVVHRKRVRVLEVLILWKDLFTGDICKDSPGCNWSPRGGFWFRTRRS